MDLSKGTPKLHGIEHNSADNPYQYSEAGWKFKTDFEKFKKKYATYFYESARDEDGNIIYIKHRNQG